MALVKLYPWTWTFICCHPTIEKNTKILKISSILAEWALCPSLSFSIICVSCIPFQLLDEKKGENCSSWCEINLGQSVKKISFFHTSENNIDETIEMYLSTISSYFILQKREDVFILLYFWLSFSLTRIFLIISVANTLLNIRLLSFFLFFSICSIWKLFNYTSFQFYKWSKSL